MTLFIQDDRGNIRDAFSRTLIKNPQEAPLVQVVLKEKKKKEKPPKNKS
jgi:hypothetical protein